MTLRARSGRRDAFTLLEVILSLAILVMSLVAIGRLVDIGTDRELDIRLNNTATRLAQAKLAEFETGVEAMESTSGDFGDADSGWTWSMANEVQGTNLYVVSVTVSREMRGKPFSLTLSQMMLDPTVKGAAAEAARPDPTGGGQ